jgi:hypothetical protein
VFTDGEAPPAMVEALRAMGIEVTITDAARTGADSSGPRAVT